MKKLIIGIAIAGILFGAGLLAANAEAIWYKWYDGKYSSYKYATYLYTGIEVHFGVWPVAPGHSAGAVFTDDGWNTVMWQEAAWESNIDNPYGGQDEQWGVWMLGGNGGQYMGQDFTPFTFEFALYVNDQYGNQYWANNGGANYQIQIDSP